MIGYPKHIATMEDYSNLLASKEFNDRARADLGAVLDVADATVCRVVTDAVGGKEEVTEAISNPMPLWKIKGFADPASAGKLIGKEIVEPIEEIEPIAEEEVTR